MPKAPISIICAKVKSNKVGTIGITIERAIMFEMGTTTAITTSTEVTMVTKTIEIGPYVPPQNRAVGPRDDGGSMA